MSNRRRRLLHALALVAIAISTAAAVVLVVGYTGAPDSALAAPVRDRPAKRAAPKPTRGERAAAVALRAVGVPYRWGGMSLSGGFDCSGLVRWAYARVGVDVPHNSYALYHTGRSVPRRQLRPGDVLVFSGLGHVGLYLGHGKMVHAPYSGKTVEVVRLARSHYAQRIVGVRRVVA
jgi:cell wall-associated NlpC family hydrolase